MLLYCEIGSGTKTTTLTIRQQDLATQRQVQRHRQHPRPTPVRKATHHGDLSNEEDAKRSALEGNGGRVELPEGLDARPRQSCQGKRRP